MCVYIDGLDEHDACFEIKFQICTLVHLQLHLSIV